MWYKALVVQASCRHVVGEARGSHTEKRRVDITLSDLSLCFVTAASNITTKPGRHCQCKFRCDYYNQISLFCRFQIPCLFSDKLKRLCSILEETATLFLFINPVFLARFSIPCIYLSPKKKRENGGHYSFHSLEQLRAFRSICKN